MEFNYFLRDDVSGVWSLVPSGEFQAVEPGEELGHGAVELGRDELVEVDLHEERDELARLVDVEAVPGGEPDNRLGLDAAPLGDYAGGKVAALVGEGDRLLRLFGAPTHGAP